MLICKRKKILMFLLVILQGAALVMWHTWYINVSSDTSKSSNDKVHVLLLSSWRSGSSFTGQVFNQHPHVFYLMEPAHSVWSTLKQEKARTLRMAVRDELWSLFHCDFSVMASYLPENPKVSSLFMWEETRALCSPPGCPQIPPDKVGTPGLCHKLCGAAPLQHVEKICSNHSHVVFKVVRVFELESLYPLFKNSNLNLRIVHLVRDPRAVKQSRENTAGDLRMDLNILVQNIDDRVVDPQLMALKEICSSHVRISETALLNPPPFLKGRYKMIRYEDMVRNPLDEINSLYEFVGLDMTKQLADWIYKETHGEDKVRGDFDTGSRDAVKVSEAWRTKMSPSNVERVQQVCEEAMSLLGYKPVNSPEEQHNLDIDVLLPPKLHRLMELQKGNHSNHLGDESLSLS